MSTPSHHHRTIAASGQNSRGIRPSAVSYTHLDVYKRQVLVGVFLGWWFLQNPQVEQSLLSPGEIDQLVNHDFATYYSCLLYTSRCV